MCVWGGRGGGGVNGKCVCVCAHVCVRVGKWVGGWRYNHGVSARSRDKARQRIPYSGREKKRTQWAPTHTHTHAPPAFLQTCTHTHIHTRPYICIVLLCLQALLVALDPNHNTHTHINTHAHAPTHPHTHIHTNTHTHTPAHTRPYICIILLSLQALLVALDPNHTHARVRDDLIVCAFARARVCMCVCV